MATIKPVAEPRLPFNGDTVLSERSLPRISRLLHEEIQTQVEWKLGHLISKIRRKDLELAVGKSFVDITTKNHVMMELIVLSITANVVEILLPLPLRGSMADLEFVINRLIERLRLNKSFYAQDGGLGAVLTLKSGPVRIQMTLNGPGETREVLVTEKEARV